MLEIFRGEPTSHQSWADREPRRLARNPLRAAWQAALLAAAMVVSVPGWAHHSFTQFDPDKSLVLDGMVTSFEWTNPHGWLWVSVADGNGGAQIWGAETKAPAGLMRDGWTKRSFNPGDKVKLFIHPMRNGSRAGEFVKAVLADGKVLEPLGGSPGGPARNAQPPTAH